MATKKAKKANTTAKKFSTSKRQAIPFDKIAKLYAEGKTMEAIAKEVNRWNEKADDPSKSLRAIVSGMITKGYKNAKGEVVRLEKRPRLKVKQSKDAPKPKKATVKPKSTPKLKASAPSAQEAMTVA